MRRRVWISLATCALVFAQSPAPRTLAKPPKTPERTSDERVSDSNAPADLEITVSQDAVTRIAAAAMPLTLRGTSTVKVELPVVGFVEVKAPWVAVVSNPQISIVKDAASFEADVAVTVEPLNYEDKVHGQLDVNYDKKKNQLVAKMKDVTLNLNLRHQGVGTTAKVDVTDQMPPIELPVGLPDPVLKIAKKTLRVELSPTIKYLEGRVRVSSALKLVEAKNAPKRK